MARTLRMLKCDKCRKRLEMTVLILPAPGQMCIGVKLCVPCARKFLRKPK